MCSDAWEIRRARRELLALAERVFPDACGFRVSMGETPSGATTASLSFTDGYGVLTETDEVHDVDDLSAIDALYARLEDLRAAG